MHWTKPWLFQRLTKPFPPDHQLAKTGNPFAFGGGYKNGGLSDEAMAMLMPIFRFDYMGAAEYEFGALPEALTTLFKNVGDYVPFSFEIKPEDIEIPNYREMQYARPEKPVKIHVLSHKDHQKEAEKILREGAKGTAKIRDSMLFWNACCPPTKECRFPSDLRGWINLENAFFAFTDQDMFNKTVDLFQAKVDKEAE